MKKMINNSSKKKIPKEFFLEEFFFRSKENFYIAIMFEFQSDFLVGLKNVKLME